MEAGEGNAEQSTPDMIRLRCVRTALFISGLALLAHLGYFALDRDHEAGDTPTYIAAARGILEGRGFVGIDGEYDTLRTPVYPLMLAIFYGLSLGDRAVVLVQHLLTAALAVWLLKVAWRFTRSRFIGLTAAVIFVVDLPTIHHANKVLTEALFTPILFAVFVLTIRASGSDRFDTAAAMLTGLLGGLTVLVRPISLFLFAPLVLYLILCANRHRLRKATLLRTASCWLGPAQLCANRCLHSMFDLWRQYAAVQGCRHFGDAGPGGFSIQSRQAAN
jgi:hypothetical protein